MTKCSSNGHLSFLLGFVTLVHTERSRSTVEGLFLEANRLPILAIPIPAFRAARQTASIGARRDSSCVFFKFSIFIPQTLAGFQTLRGLFSNYIFSRSKSLAHPCHPFSRFSRCTADCFNRG